MSIAWAATQYLYDDLGRLVLAVNPDGSAIVYSHDANGSVVSIIQTGTTGPIVAAFSPAQGHAGSAVTITGTGFGATPAQNTVTIGGLPATVTAASASSITTSIPQGAHTGPIAVTVAGVTATSAQNIVVLWPTITSFTPTLVAPGAPVTLSGTNLNLVPGATSISVGAAAATISSITNNQIVFAAPSSGTGVVTVSTPYGQTATTSPLFVVPTSIGAANVIATVNEQPGGSAQTLTVNQQNKYGLLTFDGVAGQYLSIQVDSFSTTPSTASVSYQVFSPSGASLMSGSVSSTSLSVHLPPLPTTGTYMMSFGSGTNTATQLATRIELNATLNPDGTLSNASTIGLRQSKRLIFIATAGDDLSLALTGLSPNPSSPNYVLVQVSTPSGNNVVNNYCYTTTTPGCEFNLLNLPETGTYKLIVVPQGAQTLSLGLTLSQDMTASLTAGTPLNLSLGVPGRLGLPTFTATAGQTVALNMSSIATTPSGKSVAMRVYNASGSQITWTSSTTGATLNLTNLAAGTYNVLLQPADAATATMNVTLVNGLVGTLPTDGTSQSFSAAVPEQNGYFTFTANAGDDLALALTGLSFTPSSPNYVQVSVIQPNGQLIMNGQYCYQSSTPGCSFSLTNVPASGTYQVVVAAATGSMASYTLRVSQDVAGTLTPGSPLTLNLDQPGRQGWLSFTATAGQTVALNMSSIATTPSGKSVAMRVYNASGSQITWTSSTTGATLNLTNLAAGTYNVLLQPADAATATLQLQIQ